MILVSQKIHSQEESTQVEEEARLGLRGAYLKVYRDGQKGGVFFGHLGCVLDLELNILESRTDFLEF